MKMGSKNLKNKILKSKNNFKEKTFTVEPISLSERNLTSFNLALPLPPFKYLKPTIESLSTLIAWITIIRSSLFEYLL